MDGISLFSHQTSEWGKITVTLTLAWLLVPDWVVWVFLKNPILLTSWEFHTQRHLSIHRMVQRKNQTNSNKPSAWGLNILLLKANRGERPDQAELKGSIVTIVTQISTLYKRGEQKSTSEFRIYIKPWDHIRIYSCQPRTMIWDYQGHSPKLDSWKLEKVKVIFFLISN